MTLYELPEAIGPYRPLELIGEGGFGVVYLVRNRGTLLAVKVLNPYVNGTIGGDELRARLRREVETMQRVVSPHVAEIVDFDLDSRPPYIVTRYVQGLPLRDLVSQDGPLDSDRLFLLATGLAEALTAIHASACVHRDLKPANVMMVEEKDPVIIDFGIAHEIDATRITRTGATGTVGYMAPELILGGTAGPPVDIFAWAATVAYASTGRRAFSGDNEAASNHQILTGEPDLRGVPEGLSELLAEALARDPADRPMAQELLRRLAELEPRKGADEVVRVELDLAEAVSGAVRELDDRPGLRIEIPAGAEPYELAAAGGEPHTAAKTTTAAPRRTSRPFRAGERIAAGVALALLIAPLALLPSSVSLGWVMIVCGSFAAVMVLLTMGDRNAQERIDDLFIISGCWTILVWVGVGLVSLTHWLFT
jgi:predicted Ser/Thr protein kinase